MASRPDDDGTSIPSDDTFGGEAGVPGATGDAAGALEDDDLDEDDLGGDDDAIDSEAIDQGTSDA